jgi:alpha-beta hydrolase superfamily lysophospholipase
MENQIKLWEPSSEESIKGTIFIIHGMGEYSKRYKEMANYFKKNGYRVATIDHLGHGKNIKKIDELGLIKDEFKSSLEDVIESIEKIRNNKPLFILGHSMGSFMAQILLERGIRSDGIILSGSARPSKILIKFGYFLSRLLLLFGNRRDFILNKLLFGRNSLKFLGDKSFRWLSRNEESVKEYGFGVKKLYKFYEKIGYRDITLKLYTKGRHEMLNEINSQEVYNDLLKWLDRRLKR